MKAEELRIGNLLLWETIKDSEPSIFVGYDNEIVMIKHLSDSSDDYYSLGCSIKADWLKPIPLTEEWNLKLGATEKKVAGCDSEFVIFIGDFEFNWDKENGLDMMESGSNADFPTDMKHIKYVHQYQNLIFALTNKELVYEKKTDTYGVNNPLSEQHTNQDKRFFNPK